MLDNGLRGEYQRKTTKGLSQSGSCHQHQACTQLTDFRFQEVFHPPPPGNPENTDTALTRPRAWSRAQGSRKVSTRSSKGYSCPLIATPAGAETAPHRLWPLRGRLSFSLVCVPRISSVGLQLQPILGARALWKTRIMYILANCRNPACASLRRRGNRVTHIARTSALPGWGRSGQPHGPDRRATGDYRNYPTIKEMSQIRLRVPNADAETASSVPSADALPA